MNIQVIRNCYFLAALFAVGQASAFAIERGPVPVRFWVVKNGEGKLPKGWSPSDADRIIQDLNSEFQGQVGFWRADYQEVNDAFQYYDVSDRVLRRELYGVLSDLEHKYGWNDGAAYMNYYVVNSVRSDGNSYAGFNPHDIPMKTAGDFPGAIIIPPSRTRMQHVYAMANIMGIYAVTDPYLRVPDHNVYTGCGLFLQYLVFPQNRKYSPHPSVRKIFLEAKNNLVSYSREKKVTLLSRKASSYYRPKFTRIIECWLEQSDLLPLLQQN